jgi:hypothetical protein
MVDSLRGLLSEGAGAWNTSPGVVLGIAALPFLIALVGFATALMGKEAYKAFTGEDGIAETLQAILYAAALVLSLVVGRRLWTGEQKIVGVLYFVLSLGFFFLVGEELSWGQRLLGWGTPEALEAMNKQGETNLHNIHGVGYTFKWIQLLVGAYGAVLPLVLPAWSALARYRSTLSLLIPHFTLVPYFAFMFFWRVYRNLFEAPSEYYFAVAEFNEVVELILAAGFLLFLFYQLGRVKARRKVFV